MKCQISWLTVLLHTSVPQPTGTASCPGLNLKLMIPLSALFHHFWSSVPSIFIISMIVIRKVSGMSVYSKEVLRQEKGRKKRSERPAEKTNSIFTEKEGLQSTLLDLIAVLVRPTASSSYVVIMTSPLPGKISLMTLLNSSMNCVKESVPLPAGNKILLSTYSNIWTLSRKNISLFTLHFFFLKVLSLVLCVQFTRS